jgi:hypothetical protein
MPSETQLCIALGSTPYDVRVSCERFRTAAGFAFADTIEELTDALAAHYTAVRT